MLWYKKRAKVQLFFDLNKKLPHYNFNCHNVYTFFCAGLLRNRYNFKKKSEKIFCK
jgi:hypothetical protein